MRIPRVIDIDRGREQLVSVLASFVLALGMVKYANARRQAARGIPR